MEAVPRTGRARALTQLRSTAEVLVADPVPHDRRATPITAQVRTRLREVISFKDNVKIHISKEYCIIIVLIYVRISFLILFWGAFYM